LDYELFQGEAFERAQCLLDRIDQVAAETGKTVTQIVVNWTLSQPGIISVLCGAKRAWQIEESAGAMGWELTPQQRQLLEM
jgi:aryl-alcohol dehydrogenase-like predicted oxidoreductase